MQSLEWLWPTRCGGCDAEGDGALCAVCLGFLRVRARDPVTGIRGVLGAAGYDTPIGDALKRAKYGADRGLMQVLATHFANTLAPIVAGSGFEAVVHVPSPWTRRWQRGFATGAVLAEALSRRVGVPVVDALRISPGARNAGLTALGRRHNLAGRVRSRRPVAGHVLLVDDVFTTGATAEACARELLGTASATVWLASLCTADRNADGSADKR